MTVPRWRTLTGIPMTLAKVVEDQGKPRLAPYPDWQSQTVGDCSCLQYVQSMEVDPNTGLMYVIDVGRIGILGPDDVTPRNLCPAKIVVYDLNTNSRVASYDLPADVVSRDNNFINDLVLDYVDGAVRYAYITDVTESRLHVFDFLTKTAWNVEHRSMRPEVEASVIPINGVNYTFSAGLDGIAMSADFRYVYYCPLGGVNLYQIPTNSLRQGKADQVKNLGRKVSQSDGLAYG